MRWLRPTVPHDDADAVIQEVEAQIQAAAAEAPPSRREEEIRASLLEEVGADRMPIPGLAPLALVAGALLLALVIGLGAPAVGSFLGELLDRGPEPTEDGVLPVPSITDRAEVDDVPIPTDLPIPTRDVPTPASEPVDVADDPDDVDGGGPPATYPADPQPSMAPPAEPLPSPEPWPPGGPPSPMPTPPPTGPPDGPGG